MQALDQLQFVVRLGAMGDDDHAIAEPLSWCYGQIGTQVDSLVKQAHFPTRGICRRQECYEYKKEQSAKQCPNHDGTCCVHG